MSEQRFLLILNWDGTDYVSAPITCPSVARIKVEIERARLQTSEKVKNAGLGVLGHALGCRLACRNSDKDSIIEGSKKYRYQDPDFAYTVNAALLIPANELDDWRNESLGSGRVADCMYQVCRIDGNI